MYDVHAACMLAPTTNKMSKSSDLQMNQLWNILSLQLIVIHIYSCSKYAHKNKNKIWTCHISLVEMIGWKIFWFWLCICDFWRNRQLNCVVLRLDNLRRNRFQTYKWRTARIYFCSQGLSQIAPYRPLVLYTLCTKKL